MNVSTPYIQHCRFLALRGGEFMVLNSRGGCQNHLSHFTDTCPRGVAKRQWKKNREVQAKSLDCMPVRRGGWVVRSNPPKFWHSQICRALQELPISAHGKHFIIPARWCTCLRIGLRILIFPPLMFLTNGQILSSSISASSHIANSAYSWSPWWNPNAQSLSSLTQSGNSESQLLYQNCIASWPTSSFCHICPRYHCQMPFVCTPFIIPTWLDLDLSWET